MDCYSPANMFDGGGHRETRIVNWILWEKGIKIPLEAGW